MNLGTIKLNMKEFLDNLVFRYKSLLALPTNNGNYFDTITNCLTYVKKNSPSLNEFSDWFCKQYNVCKDNSYNSRKILERANLVLVKTNKHLSLTIEGIKCFTDDPSIIISRCFLDAYEGMMEILILLEEGTAYRKKELFNIWYERYNNSFNSTRNFKSCRHQFNIMLNYLIDFKLIKNSQNDMLTLNSKLISNLFLHYEET